MTIEALLSYLLDRYPLEQAESWDHVGLSAGDPHAEITGVLIALDASAEAVRRAADLGANVLVTHHPVYISAPKSFTPVPDAAHNAAGAAVFEAIRRGVSIISLHTNLDRDPEARNHLASLLGATPEGSFEHPDDPALPGLGSVGVIPATTLGDVARRAANAFSSDPRVWGPPEQSVRRIAVLGGSLGDLAELALSSHVDAVICGEAGYHVCQDLWLRGCSVVLLGHDRSEQPFVDILSKAVASAGIDPSSIATMECPRQWWTTYEGERA